VNDGAGARQPASDISGALAEIVARAVPGGVLLGVEPLAPDAAGSNRTAKAVGYGEPLRLRVRDATGAESMLVFHTAHPDVFGHDRRADRAAEMLLSYDRFPLIPRHSRALDVGALRKDGRGLISLRDAGEFYLLTTFASGHVYADELRRIGERGALDDSDLAHADQLARHLVEVHSEKYEKRAAYTRSVRDVLGSGEGIFGMIDGYPEGVPGASRDRLQGIERRCLEWRWCLRGQEHRLSRIHGDYHPFNIVFDDRSALTLLDSSRGSCGDPADDVTCLAINYVFFAIEKPALWRTAFRELWTRFWRTYLAGSGDRELLGVAAPFLAWRGLVVCNPVWYPHVGGPERDRMLTLIERALDEKAFDPRLADEVFV
jgi:hypothetical protein